MIDGTTIRHLRLQRGWSQSQLAELVGIPASVLSAYERGRREPGVSMASRIIDTLGFRIQFTPRPDPLEQGRVLQQVLELAEALPFAPRPMPKARR